MFAKKAPDILNIVIGTSESQGVPKQARKV